MDIRLKTIASYIENGLGFIDVGTDHGYIPAELAKGGYTGHIFASDINSAPLQKAMNTAKASGVDDRISFLLCDGLSKCDRKQIDTIVIAGMGGDTIVRILDEAEWCMKERYKLILQPMTKAEVVRYWLVYNGFEILTEDLVQDDGTIYQIIVTRFSGCTVLSDGEQYAGKYELAGNKALYLKHVDLLIDRFKKAMQGMVSGEAATGYKLNFLSGVCAQLEEIRSKYGHC